MSHMVIGNEVAHQARAIGVVAEQAAVLAQRQRVHGAGALRARREFVDQARGGFLVRNGDVEALAAAGEELAHGRLELLRASRRWSCTTSDWPVCAAKRAWMKGERLCCTGWPMTA